MELLYIYLGEVKDKTKSYVFQNQGFKFTSEFKISFDKESNNLTIYENEDYDPNFYKVKDEYKAPFKLTCVVGENGAGKSCFLEMIMSLLNKDLSFPSFDLFNYNKELIIWKTDNSINYYSYNLENLNICSNISIIKKDFVDFRDDIKNINIIFYSNFLSDFDKNIFNGNIPNSFDISTDYLIDYELDNAITNYQFKIIDRLSLFRTIDLKRKVLFYLKQQDFINKFDNLKRHYIVISPTKCDFELLLERYKDYSELVDFINYSKEYIEKKLDNKSSKKDILFWLFARELWYQCLHLIKEDVYFSIFSNDFDLMLLNDYKNQFANDLKPENFVSYLIDYIYKIFNYKRESVNLLTFSFVYFSDNSKKYFKILKELYDISNINNDNKGIKICLNSDNSDLKTKLISELFDTYSIFKSSYSTSAICGDFLKFSFEPRFSSGEKALITLFSRLYYLINNDFKFSNSKNDLVFFIDEAELGFHPQWCKEYIKIVLSYIQNIFTEFKIPIHLIITTNNPIVLSDILPADVIYLKNRDSLKENEQPKQAFGSNILDLYSDNFFIQDGLIGSFAQKKISDLLERINDGKIDKKYDENLIKNIGDINIRNYLTALYNDAKKKFDAKNGGNND